MGILLSSTGTTSLGILTVQGSKVVVKGTSLIVLKKMVTLLGGKITQTGLKTMFARWVPIAGAAAMGAWSRYSTLEIGKFACNVFNKEIQISKDQIDDVIIEENSDKILPEPSIHFEKMKVLINLLKIDRKIDTKEVKFMDEFIKKSDINPSDKTALIESLSNDKTFEIDYGIFKNSHMESTGMLMDMIALIQLDDNLHFSEKIYFKKVAEEIGIEKDQVEELLTELK